MEGLGGWGATGKGALQRHEETLPLLSACLSLCVCPLLLYPQAGFPVGSACVVAYGPAWGLPVSQSQSTGGGSDWPVSVKH